ncbi:MAG TPA: FAD/NAD(P)-binding protein [Polyangiaceae bacterium]|nr:FAD/NAD(P)-binding protein [Polyangiaceae bacterium]
METDYLVIGAGAMGLAFADELLTRTDAHITIIDRRHAPGGHWNDAYSFVRLHQPSIFYGVESKELAEYRIDDSGPNQGFLGLAEGPAILAYFHSLMSDRFLPSGRVRFLPLCEMEADGSVRALLSRERHSITVRKKLVDASYLTNSIPLTHEKKFSVAKDVICVPPNELPRLAAHHRRFTVLGAGKTGIDTCCWLLAQGAPANSIRWIVPRDAWFLNRATMQPGPEFFAGTFGTFAAAQEALAAATSARDYAHRMEAAGAWLRLDRAIEPDVYHAATVSEGELRELRRIRDIVRLGRARSLETDRLLLERGELRADAGTLYVDCTASALARPEPVPVFAGNQITLQMIRFPQLPFSAAFAAFLEATMGSDDEKNRFVAPIRISDTVEEYLVQCVTDAMNRAACSRHPAVRDWIGASRTNGFARVMRTAEVDESVRLAVLERIREASKRAEQNLPRLVATLERARQG